MRETSFDAVVVGGGHAGAEAVRLIARAGYRVALVTMDRNAIGRMSCNPAIGGLAKGHLVKEIDALGGLMAEATDASAIQFKTLNRSKGPAVQGPRAQCDRDLYSAAVRQFLEREPNVTIVEAIAASVELDRDAVQRVVLEDGSELRTRAAILTTGTFLRSLMHLGEQKTIGGRFGEASANSMSGSLSRLGLKLGRLKTGTPPRVFRHSTDFSQMEEQPGDDRPRLFSILSDRVALPQLLCYLTYTTAETHDLIQRNIARAPLYSGQIVGTGPRYCPSIEDKVVRFADKPRHHVFVEPDGLESELLYLNGISTSLPTDVQELLVRSIPGFQNAVIARYGYAVEYDFVNPEQLDSSLQVRNVGGLFLAGQINGTSGYEEAAAQGLIAGINAVQLLREEDPIVLRRDQGYTGVMIDDLVTLGTEEPYRMFTSRAEYRLLLGCDSVYERLSPLARDLGHLDDERARRIDSRNQRVASARAAVIGASLAPASTELWSESSGIELSGRVTVAKLMQRADLDLDAFLEFCRVQSILPELSEALAALSEEEIENATTPVRYAGYIERQHREAARVLSDEGLRIPAEFDFAKPGLSREVVEKLTFVRPATLGQAARVRGVTPSAISILRIHLKQRTATQDERRREVETLRRTASGMDS